MSDENREHRALLRETADRLFEDHLDRANREAAENGTWPAALWTTLEENGLTQPLVEELGGSTWQEAQVILQASAYHAAPLPLAETTLAGWLLDRAGLSVPEGALSVASLGDALRLDGDQLAGDARRVPWGRDVARVVVAGGGRVALVDAGAAALEEGSNLAHEPRDDMGFDGVTVEAAGALPASLGVDPVARYGALLRAVQMVGGLEHLLDESVRFAGERVQFGRPIGKFQAIQHMLAGLASQTACAGMAADRACIAAVRADDDAEFEIAVAKLRTGEAAGVGAGIAHQVHGAIGFTYEHALHFVTRRLWSWRAEFGAESQWAEALGRRAAARGATALWADLTARSSAA